MAIPSVMQGLIETEDGKVFELDSPKGAAWLEAIGSFRYEPTGDGKPYTVRKEASAYWYGCRKIDGKVRKKYIGKSSEVTVAKLEEIAEALEVPAELRVKQVAEVAQQVAQVAQGVAEVAEDRLTALEVQVANLQKALEALQEALPGKLESGDFLELPKVDNRIVEQLQNDLGNLKVENEKLRADYAALLESSTHVTNKLQDEVRELRSQLEAKKTSWDKLWEELGDSESACTELRSQLATERADREELETQLADLKQNSAPASERPEAADLLNRLKAKRKKSGASLADIEALLEMIDEG